VVIWKHKWGLTSIFISFGTQVAARVIVHHFYVRGLWAYRSDLHFALAQTHAAFALVAILLSVLAIRRERGPAVGYVGVGLGFLNLLGTSV
jgi:hypothetical protein